MAIIEIRDILNNETGETIFPRTHVDAVIGLKDNSFFETVPDTQDPTKYSVKLKDEYTGLWADGWIAAGGIGTGSGGGGGLIQTVYTWSELQEMSSSPADDTSSAFNAKAVYEIYQLLQSGGLGGGGYLKEASGGFFLTSSSEKILLKGAGHSLSGLDDVSIYNPAVNDLLTWSGYSWINIPQSAVRPDMSGYVTTDAFGAAILDLQTQIAALENFFELDGSGNVTLKSTYQNLWVPGWLAAGGIGTGGGGGGSQVLDDLLDVTISSPSNGDVLVYNGTGWINGQASAGADLPAVWASLTNSTTDSYANTKIDIAHIPNITTSKITDIETWIAGKGYASDSDFENLSGRVSDLEDESFFALDGNGNVTLKSGYSNLWVPGWMAAGGTGSGSGGGSTVQVTNYGSSGTGKIATISVDGVDTDIYNDIAWGTATYTNNTVDVNINGTTKRLCLNGYSSGGSGSGSVTSVGMTVPTGLSVTGSPITSSGTLAVSFATGYSIPTTAKQSNWDTAYGWGNHASAGYVTLSGNQEIEGPKTFKTYDVTLRSVSLLPYSNGSCSIGGDVKRFSNIYGNNVHIGSAKLSYEDEVLLLSGIDPMGGNDVGLKLNSYIDIGDARLEYDSDAYALRVTKRSGYARTIGLYADGFVAAGGTAASASRNIVFTDGTQTISGLKTFTNTVTLDGSGLDSGVNALNVTGTVSVNGNISASTFGGGIVIEKDAQTYRHISVSDDRLYIQKSVSQDLVLCNGNTSHCVVGTYESPGTNKLYVNGTALATAWNTTSDSRLKDDITALSKDDAIEKLMRLKPSIWKWNSGLAKGHTASGFIAQEVEPVLPFMVTGEDYKGLSYQMLHAYEVSAIQSHEERISALEKKLND